MRRPLRATLVLALLVALCGGLSLPASAVVSSGGLQTADRQSQDRDDDDDDDDDGDKWKDGRLQLLSGTLPSFLPGQGGWIGLNWTATTDVCGIEVTATSPGAVVTYPTNTASFSSLYINNALADTNRDYTGFQVTVSPGTTKTTTLTLRATYTKIPPGQVKKSDDLRYKDVACKGGKKVTETSTVNLPVRTPKGEKVVLDSATATISPQTPTWVPLTFSTEYAGLDNFRVRLSPPAGLEVVYPGDGSTSGLASQSMLPVGVPDNAAVRLAATSLDRGSYKVPVKATWTGGSFDTELTLKVQ